jgi:hypothetical protein
VVELFEARRPKEPAVITEIDGTRGDFIERPTTGLEDATYEAEYLVEPEHIKEGAEV